MVIVLIGPSGAGKSTIENKVFEKGFEKIVSCTTRKPRSGEINGVHYRFIDNDTFKEAAERGLFAEYDEYSQGRIYGTLKKDYLGDKNKVTVLTPNGLRQIKKTIGEENIFSVLVTANLSTRMIRYIDRCGKDFNFDDKNEICARVERDFGMFLGVENEVDLVVENDDDADPGEIAEYIIEMAGIEHV